MKRNGLVDLLIVLAVAFAVIPATAQALTVDPNAFLSTPPAWAGNDMAGDPIPDNLTGDGQSYTLYWNSEGVILYDGNGAPVTQASYGGAGVTTSAVTPTGYRVYLDGVKVAELTVIEATKNGNGTLSAESPNYNKNRLAYCFYGLAPEDTQTLAVEALYSGWYWDGGADTDSNSYHQASAVSPRYQKVVGGDSIDWKKYSLTAAFTRTKVAYGSTISVSGTVKKNSGVGDAPVSRNATSGVVEMYRDNGNDRAPSRVASASVRSDGTYTLSYKPTKNSKFSVVFAGGIEGKPSAYESVTVTPKVSSVYANGSIIYRNKTYSFYGYVNPKASLSLKVYKKNRSGAYVYYKTVTGSYYRKTSSGYRFNAKWRPTATGKYRIHFRSGTLAGMNDTRGVYRYLTVK